MWEKVFYMYLVCLHCLNAMFWIRLLAIQINQQLNNERQLDETKYGTHSAIKQISISKSKLNLWVCCMCLILTRRWKLRPVFSCINFHLTEQPLIRVEIFSTNYLSNEMNFCFTICLCLFCSMDICHFMYSLFIFFL